MHRTSVVLCLITLLSTAALLRADELRLHNSTTVTGSFVGGNTRSLRFIGDDGELRTYSVGDIENIRFLSTASTTVPYAPAPSRAPATPARAQRPLRAAASAPQHQHSATIPGGTVITVRLIDSIDADVTGAGERFRASIDDPITIGGQIVIPRGADATVQVVRVEQAGKISGSDEIALKLYDIVVNGKQYELATNYAEVKGKGQGKRTAKTTAITTGVGAVLGGIFGGGKGAAIGAGAGAGAGIAVSAARGKNLRIPSESRLDFVLRAPLGIE